MKIIEAKNITKRFGAFEALRGMELELHSGECLGLLGPNGAGKSTFINIVYGATLRTGGELRLFGLDPATDAKGIKQRLGVVPQENALDEALSVFENMRLFSRFVDLPKDRVEARVGELLQYMALDHKKGAPIRSLSGGMKRRLAFVRALLADPELLILDEPTTGLDPSIRHLLWQKVSDLRKKGKTILMTTHYMHEAEALCDRIIILNQGRVVGEGSPRALIAQHAPGFVAAFGSEMGERIKSILPNGWTHYVQRDSFCVRASSLPELVQFQQAQQIEALQLRPANLEDVYLKLTGEELSQND